MSEAMVSEMLRPRSDRDENGESYGLGVWLDLDSGAVQLIGADAGASFASLHDPERRITYTVIANTVNGAWPVRRAVMAHLGEPSQLTLPELESPTRPCPTLHLGLHASS